MSKRTRTDWSATRLGMDRPITRRDFLQGMGMGVGAAAAACPCPASFAAGAAADPAYAAGSAVPIDAQSAPGYYPPRLTGLRGSHPGSFEAAHDLRNGAPVSEAIETGEEYDLIVVGAGISGLSAAHFYRAMTSPQSRILILDNHDDFGGHAKRNEFELHGRVHLNHIQLAGRTEQTVLQKHVHQHNARSFGVHKEEAFTFVRNQHVAKQQFRLGDLACERQDGRRHEEFR